MEIFLKFYNSQYRKFGWCLEIYHSSIMDWCITVGYKTNHPKHGEVVIYVSDCDINLVFAKAQCQLKKWLLKHNGGY